jgi:hypothetical protein
VRLGRLNLVILIRGLKLLLVLHACNDLEHFSELIQVISILPCTKTHIVKEVSLLLCGKINAILFINLEEFAPSDKVVLGLTHALISETIYFLYVNSLTLNNY